MAVLAGGYGTVESGNFTDDDFFRTAGGLFSRTRSTVDDGNVYYVNVSLGGRVIEWRDFEGRKGFVDALGGYQWWREKYEAFGLVNLVGSSPNLPSSIKGITHEWTWQSVRIGGRAYVPLPVGFGARVNAFFLPWSSLRLEDTHHLRTDLQQNPSVVTEGTGGFGYQVESAMTYTLWQWLGVEAGYRHWQVTLKDGDVRFRPVGTSFPKFELRKASTERLLEGPRQ